jgi:hypothetical protein
VLLFPLQREDELTHLASGLMARLQEGLKQNGARSRSGGRQLT